MNRIAIVLLASLAGLAAAAEPAPPPGYTDLAALFASLRGQHVKLMADRPLDLSVDTVGSDHFCGRSARNTLCLPYASIAYVWLREPGTHQVVIKSGIRLP
ncbi:MAG: hypothetical protein KF903_13700 [Dokdonella sp.]|uniref:hypothetical protein n=1 Tax=Dokdonella sp. TaxID=2291710 RepID=UPI0025BD01F8|nr:hypothetical protein [Dokdonella sp.]MBX3702041.1 hypothetical protein [Dokdonella sp.]MCW5577048.1 hypothetical protein [Dokdonella sp.]